MSDSFWKAIDELHVSLYPIHQMKKLDLDVIQYRAKKVE
jgi:hypothetical protein